MSELDTLRKHINRWGAWIGVKPAALEVFSRELRPEHLDEYARIRSALLAGEKITAEPIPQAIAALSALLEMRKQHEQRGIGEEISRATGADIALWIEEYHRKSGQWGLANTSWTRNHLSGKLYRLGRLQFVATPCKLKDLRPTDPVKLDDPILEVHIPSGEPLSAEACLASFEAAKKFYSHEMAVGFTCVSWLLGPNLAQALPETSNVVKFMRMFQQLPSNQNDRQLWERVFDMEPPTDLANVPQATSMQRAIVEYYRKGGTIPSGVGFRAINA
jgi:hypothetical protein